MTYKKDKGITDSYGISTCVSVSGHQNACLPLSEYMYSHKKKKKKGEEDDLDYFFASSLAKK